MKISDLTQSPPNSPPFESSNTLPEFKRCVMDAPPRLLRRHRTRKPVVFANGAHRWKRECPAPRLDAPAIALWRGSRSVGVGTVVSVRKLAAGMWLHLAADVTTSGGGGGGGGGGRTLECGTIYRSGFEHQSSWQFPTFITERATKWDPGYSKPSTEFSYCFSHAKLPKNQQGGSALEAQLIQAQTCIHKLETDRLSLKKKEHKLVDDLKHELNRERRNCERVKFFNSKLIGDLADATLTAKEFMLQYEKERKMRDLLEEMCHELAKKIEEGKAKVEDLKRDYVRLHEEIEEERKMLQIAEVWREERVQVKMFDAKLILEEKYRQMNNLVADLESFLSSRDVNLGMIEMSEAEVIREAVNSVGIQDIKEFTSMPPKSNSYSTDEDRQKDQAIIKLEIETNQLHNSNVQGNSNDSGTVTLEGENGSSYKPDGKEHERVTGQESLSSKNSKICSLSSKKPKNNMSSLCKLSKSSLGNGNVHNKILVEGSGKLVNGSTESRNPHITRGMKGCIEWPRGIQKYGLKAKLLEARLQD